MKPAHILVFVIVPVILFGASKLPEVAKYLGQSAKILKKEIREIQDDGSDTKGDHFAASESSQSTVGGAPHST